MIAFVFSWLLSCEDRKYVEQWRLHILPDFPVLCCVVFFGLYVLTAGVFFELSQDGFWKSGHNRFLIVVQWCSMFFSYRFFKQKAGANITKGKWPNLQIQNLLIILRLLCATEGQTYHLWSAVCDLKSASEISQECCMLFLKIILEFCKIFWNNYLPTLLIMLFWKLPGKLPGNNLFYNKLFWRSLTPPKSIVVTSNYFGKIIWPPGSSQVIWLKRGTYF